MNRIIKLSVLIFLFLSYADITFATITFKGKALSAASIKIVWDNVSDEADGIVIQRTSNGSTYYDIATLPASQRAYVDTTVSASAPYMYKIVEKTGSRVLSESEVLGIATPPLPVLPAITSDISGQVTTQYTDPGNTEELKKIIDGDLSTAYVFANTKGWITYYFPAGAAVEQYSISAAADNANRDPKDWTLEGSTDNSTWTTIDTRQNQLFPARGSRLHFSVSVSQAYKYYRLSITDNNGNKVYTQLAEFTLYADVNIVRNTTAPIAPSDFDYLKENNKNNTVQIMPSSNQIILKWKDMSANEDGFVLESSTDNTNWAEVKRMDKDNTQFRVTDLQHSTRYYFRLKSLNDAGSSEWVYTDATTMSNIPAQEIIEDWDVHTQRLTLQYYDEEVAIYYDDDMDPTITWPRELLGKMWKYVKETYGSYSDPRLDIYFHAGKYSGGHPSTWARADQPKANRVCSFRFTFAAAL